jgi:uncharacterized protein YbjT (DUF2867 family)
MVQADAILVTGATGHVGRHVVQGLRRRGLPVRALARRPDPAGADGGRRVSALAVILRARGGAGGVDDRPAGAARCLPAPSPMLRRH